VLEEKGQWIYPIRIEFIRMKNRKLPEKYFHLANENCKQRK
jgi:hypothetical protein